MSVEKFFKNDQCEWVDVEQPTEADLKYLQDRYHINELLLEDTTDPNHIPKYEENDGIKFFLTRENTELERQGLNSTSDITTKIGIFLVENHIVTIHRLKNKSIYDTRDEVLRSKEKSDYKSQDIALALALKIIKTFDDESKLLMDKMDKMENEIFLNHNSNSNQIRRLYRLKRKAGLNTRVLNLSSDWINNFKKLELDHVEIVDLLDKHKDVIADFDHLNAQATNLISMYLALSDQKANQVMKLLAMFSVYFLPITFIAGLYGMNFDYMPELHHKYGYYFTLGLMGFIVLITFIYFKTKKW